MVRKQIYLKAEQERALKRLSRKHGRSEAQIIRDAIDQHIASRDEERLAAWRQILATTERRQRLPRDSTVQRRGWTREDLYERGRDSRGKID